jgi:hypothetical protein
VAYFYGAATVWYMHIGIVHIYGAAVEWCNKMVHLYEAAIYSGAAV